MLNLYGHLEPLSHRQLRLLGIQHVTHPDSVQPRRATIRLHPYPLVVLDHLDGFGAGLHDLALFTECLRPEPKRHDAAQN